MKPSKSQILILVCFAAVSLGIFLLMSGTLNGIGFPLDDAWIHQVFARNLIQSGRWAFNEGVITSGSTAPLWTLILSIGYLVHLNPLIWTFFLGGSLLFIVAYLSESIMRRLIPSYSPKFPWAGMLMIFEWHLVWAAGSGMEILALSALFLTIVTSLIQTDRSWWLVGCLIGISIWLRPEGITWIAPAICVVFVMEKGFKAKGKALLKMLVPILGFMVAYSLFNFLLSHNWFPNTFYAKQLEYSILLRNSFLNRIFDLWILPLNGVGILLLPGLVYYIYIALKKREYFILFIFMWLLGFMLMYSIFLPVTYQHGRYIMPAMPVYFLLGFAGLYSWISVKKKEMWSRVMDGVWKFAAILILAAFYMMCGSIYAKDVAIIDTEMVDTASWIADNTDTNDVIAAHDIGALGYFGDRKLIDMAGLINPEVIPFIRDQVKLAAYLDAVGADYLVTFPDWYPEMVAGRNIVFSSESIYSKEAGHSNLTVYEWK